jgi:hypothetical protein
MIKSSHFFQLVLCVAKTTQYINFTEDVVNAIDSVRREHDKLQKELEYFLVYPHLDLSNAREMIKSIQLICKETDIRSTFYKKTDPQFKYGDFADYYLGSARITDLIVFKKKDKTKINPIDFYQLNEI